MSLDVQALPSLHDAPLEAVGFEQAPVVGSQTPAVWHWSVTLHTRGVPAVHTPLRQMSPVVHALPSLQTTPSGPLVFEQVPVVRSQTSSVQGLWSSQETVQFMV